MNKNIMKAMGFGDQVNLVEKGKCPFCKKQVDPGKFKDELTLKEYRISGMCEECQDGFFSKK
tara:strand:+ start:61 stop:246 length:186 start_codon:yes stop_codon:yes gene_type:complete